MSENAALHIHAKIVPKPTASPGPEPAAEPGAAESAKPMQKTRRVRSTQASRPVRPRGTISDRMLRNSAIACAVLLGVLALGNVDAPWAKKASEGVERALTMHIDLDESIGALTFVKGLMPESALVFLNVSGDSELARPVDGSVSHAWGRLQPWMMFDCPDSAPVRAAASGTVTAVSPMSGDRYGVLVDHGDGVETLYAGLARADVASGDAVARGDAIGRADGSCYFEYRRSGESIDPTEALGL